MAVNDDDGRRQRQADAQHQWNEALAHWLPVAGQPFKLRYRPIRIDWDRMPLVEMQDHDPGDEDRT